MNSSYPEGLSGRDYCYMEGCLGNGPCPRCGETNYRLMGYYGAVARWAKAWGVSEDDAAKRMTRHEIEREQVRGEITSADAEELLRDYA